MKIRLVIWLLIVLDLGIGAFAGAAGIDPETGPALSPKQFKSMVDAQRGNPDVVLLDVRTPKEFRSGHIDGAALLDYHSKDFLDRLKTLDRNKTYLIYCRSGNRSGKSLAIFGKLGFRKAYHLESGLIGWSRESYALVR